MKPLFLSLLTLFLLCLTALMFAQVPNHLDLLMTMEGEFIGSEFGSSVVSMDFNGDGYDDLVVRAQAWNQYGSYQDIWRFGKFYFYWGGPNFDTVPDAVLEGTFRNELGCQADGPFVFNAGDMNGDGCDDLIVSGVRDAQNHDCIKVFFGGAIPQTEPDIVILAPSYQYDLGAAVFPLGDINGDGLADISITWASGYVSDLCYLWTDIAAQPVLFKETNNHGVVLNLIGVGDVNMDGYNDCFLIQPLGNVNSNSQSRLVIYYGGETFPADSLVISENINQNTTRYSSAIGDVNGDGYDDFIAHSWKLWLGSDNLQPGNYLQLSSLYGDAEYLDGYPYIHTDLNHDGFEDFLGSNPGYGGESGVMTLWMGREQFNTTPDLYKFAPLDHPYQNFGWSKAIGDFNADGTEEIAISGPFLTGGSPFSGNVFIYAANDDLHDTTVANEDETLPTPSQWQFSAFPNPMGKAAARLNLRFSGQGYKWVTGLRLEIANIKGQQVAESKIPDSALKSGNWSIPLKGMATGVYLIKIGKAGSVRASGKFTLK